MATTQLHGVDYARAEEIHGHLDGIAGPGGKWPLSFAAGLRTGALLNAFNRRDRVQRRRRNEQQIEMHPNSAMEIEARAVGEMVLPAAEVEIEQVATSPER